VSQEVERNNDVPIGSLVSLINDSPQQVALADIANNDYFFGVVTEPGLSLAEIQTTGDGTAVATTGDVAVFVSTAGGPIKAGDLLAVSEVRGIAQKVDATVGQTTIGVALEDFDDSSEQARTLEALDEAGQARNVTVGSILARLAINDYYIEETASSTFLTSVGERLVGRDVSQWQAIAAAGIVLASFIAGGLSIFSSVHGSFVSIGRNPLSGNAVFNGLFYVTLIGGAVIVSGFAAGYLVLLV
jgi:hypothetical protein